MMKQRNSLKRTLVTNACIAAIIALVYFAAFGPLEDAFSVSEPALRGSTGRDVVGLQVVVEEDTDVQAYLGALDAYGVRATFFFPDAQTEAMADDMLAAMERGHGVGYYITGRSRASALYLGGGYSIPVMGYAEGGAVREVCPSIDVAKLREHSSGWAGALADALAGDMFVCVRADNNFSDFEKVVQIVLDNGYTILKVNEML